MYLVVRNSKEQRAIQQANLITPMCLFVEAKGIEQAHKDHVKGGGVLTKESNWDVFVKAVVFFVQV